MPARPLGAQGLTATCPQSGCLWNCAGQRCLYCRSAVQYSVGGAAGRTCNHKGSSCRSVKDHVLAQVSWKGQKMVAVSLKYKAKSAYGPRTVYWFAGT